MTRLMLTPDRSKIWAEPKKASLNHTDDTLAIAIGAIARMEKCRRTASCAKTIPAIGALKPAAIAPATPQPMNISVLSTPPVVCRKKLPIVAPKWTSGPYWPTDAPPLAEMKAASVDPKPDLTSSSLSLRCAAWMASAGPCHRLIPNTRRTTKMAATATSRLTIGAKEIGRSPTRSRSNNCPREGMTAL